MQDIEILIIRIVIILFFIWRFARTRQLYLFSLRNPQNGQNANPFRPLTFGSFLNKAFWGKRSLKPNSFFIRGFVFLVIAVCLLPVKNYDPVLYWLFVVLTVFYISWCVIHGIKLKRGTN